MPYELEQLQISHEQAVREFEVANRAYRAAWVTDRGDAFFAEFGERFRGLLRDQEAGECAYYVLVDGDGAVVGRFNLYDIGDGAARLGYGVAERVAGQGVATGAVRELCGLVGPRHGVRTVRASVAHSNPASQKVLLRAGFAEVGPAGPEDLGGEEGRWYALSLRA